MKRLVNAEQMRALDAAASEQHGMPSAVLMENAGAALSNDALALAEPRGRFVVICGPGNNGGDGLVAARRLFGAGRQVFVELIGGIERLKGDPKQNLLALQSVGLNPTPVPEELRPGPGDVIIDAIFGTGLARAPEGPYAEAIERIRAWRRAGAKVVAADLPERTAERYGPAVRAVRRSGRHAVVRRAQAGTGPRARTRPVR